MHIYKKLLYILTVSFFSFFVISCLLPTTFAAKPWSLSGIDLITRKYWIDDESIIFKSKKTDNITIDSDQEDSTPSTPSKIEVIDKYLTQVFPEQFLLDEVISSLDSKELKWARGYQQQKTHIVVHHTTNNLDTIKTPEDALKTINAIFKFHTQTRGWGDIGYNFIIDPWGNIYEGRGGGDSVMGAHAKYNNSPSLGIALLGNFEVNKPTDKQIEALTRLSAALMIRYRINPNNQVYAHIEDDHYPYVKDEIRTAFMGHKDTGKTSCPGKNLYEKLDQIKKDIQLQLVKMNMLFPTKPLRYIYNYPNSIPAAQDIVTVSIPYPLSSQIKTCKVVNTTIKATKCKNDKKTISFILTKKKDTVGPETILLDISTKDKSLYRIAFKVKRASDDILLLQKRRSDYIKKYGMTPAGSTSEKVKEKISNADIKNLIQQNVNVLLYELSTNYTQWNFLCQNCTITDNQGNKYIDKSFSIINTGGGLSYTSKTQAVPNISSLIIRVNKPGSRIYITNYDRKSYGGISRNNFYGTITISLQKLKKVSDGEVSEQYTLVNTVSFDEYMRGIIESNDSEPSEKIKTMAILAKNYISYYLSSSHRHPSIPVGVSYNAVDDARIFQKYVGAGVDNTLTKRKPALEETKDKFVMYDKNLAFLPYFSCSAGFTWSAAEKRGWIDTPYLQSVLDTDYCPDFAGHGVGLAGKGATALANQGLSYQKIIQYYYSGTTLETITN